MVPFVSKKITYTYKVGGGGREKEVIPQNTSKMYSLPFENMDDYGFIIYTLFLKKNLNVEIQYL